MEPQGTGVLLLFYECSFSPRAVLSFACSEQKGVRKNAPHRGIYTLSAQQTLPCLRKHLYLVSPSSLCFRKWAYVALIPLHTLQPWESRGSRIYPRNWLQLWKLSQYTWPCDWLRTFCAIWSHYFSRRGFDVLSCRSLSPHS